MEHGDLIRSQNLTDDLLERRAYVRRQTEQRVMLLEPLGGEHALRGVTRIRLVSELLRGDGQVDLRDLELRHVVDEAEGRDPQLLRRHVEIAAADVSDSPLEKGWIGIVRRGEQQPRPRTQQYGDRSTSH